LQSDICCGLGELNLQLSQPAKASYRAHSRYTDVLVDEAERHDAPWSYSPPLVANSYYFGEVAVVGNRSGEDDLQDIVGDVHIIARGTHRTTLWTLKD